MQKKINETRIFRFILVGGLCTILNIVFLYLLVTVLQIHYLFSFILVFVGGNFIGFYLNKYYTFRTKTRNLWKELWKYYSIMLSSFGINLILMYIMVKYLNVWYIYATIIITIGCTVYNYFLHNNWSFRNLNNLKNNKKRL